MDGCRPLCLVRVSEDSAFISLPVVAGFFFFHFRVVLRHGCECWRLVKLFLGLSVFLSSFVFYCRSECFFYFFIYFSLDLFGVHVSSVPVFS